MGKLKMRKTECHSMKSYRQLGNLWGGSMESNNENLRLTRLICPLQYSSMFFCNLNRKNLISITKSKLPSHWINASLFHIFFNSSIYRSHCSGKKCRFDATTSSVHTAAGCGTIEAGTWTRRSISDILPILYEVCANICVQTKQLF